MLDQDVGSGRGSGYRGQGLGNRDLGLAIARAGFLHRNVEQAD